MSLATNVTNLATRVATEVKALRTLINGNAADLSALTTTAKSSVMAAINELDAAIDALGAQEGGATINDAATSSSTVWSSSKTDSEIDAAISALVGTAPDLLNTLGEISDALADDEDFAATLTAQIAAKADAAHSHVIADVTGLDTALAGKSNTGHSHVTGDVTGLDTALAGKSNTGHGHVISDVSGLQAALDAKANAADVGDTATDFVTTFETGLV